MAYPSKLEKSTIEVGMRVAYMIGDQLICRKILAIHDDKYLLSKPWKDKNDSTYGDDNNELDQFTSLEQIQRRQYMNRADLPYY